MAAKSKPAPTQLGNHIIRLREKRGWSTAELARASNMAYTTVRNIEQGYSKKPDEAILRALAVALDGNVGVVLAYAGYGDVPKYTPDELTVRLDELGQDAPRWRAVIDGIKAEMTPDEQNQAYAVLKAQLDAARNRRRRGHP